MPIADNVLLVFCDYETTGVPAADHFPIEIGVIATDNRLHELFEFEDMILWHDLTQTIESGEEVWKEPYQKAFEFHQITPSEYFRKSRHGLAVVRELMSRLRDIDPDHNKKWILISDNIQFEYQLTKKLFRIAGKKWPFHYCGWDTSLFLDMTGIGDPQDNPHRALADTRMLLDAVKKGAELVKHL